MTWTGKQIEITVVQPSYTIRLQPKFAWWISCSDVSVRMAGWAEWGELVIWLDAGTQRSQCECALQALLYCACLLINWSITSSGRQRERAVDFLRISNCLCQYRLRSSFFSHSWRFHLAVASGVAKVECPINLHGFRCGAGRRSAND